jgi:hypothetical protein
MAFTHTITQSITQPGGATGLTASNAYTADGKTSLEIPVPEDSTDLEVTVAIDFSQLVSLYMLSDVDMTIETNNAEGTDDTITLAAGVPLIWNADAPNDNPFETDVTAFFLTTATVGDGTFKAEILEDATP